MLQAIVTYFYKPDTALLKLAKRTRFETFSIYGAGDLGRALIKKLQAEGFSLSNWYDTSAPLGENTFCGQKLSHPSELSKDSAPVMIIASELYSKEMIGICNENGFKGITISL